MSFSYPPLSRTKRVSLLEKTHVDPLHIPKPNNDIDDDNYVCSVRGTNVTLMSFNPHNNPVR
jgi:hypothetical protein